MLITDAQPAWAHATLLSTDPEYGAALAASPAQAVIRYDLPVEVKGAQVKLEQPVGRIRLSQPPRYASVDRKEVAVPLPVLASGKYLLTWFLFGSDGDVMGGEVSFSLLGSADPAMEVPGPSSAGRSPGNRAFAPLSQAQDVARLVSLASLSILIGGVTFVAALWPSGTHLRPTRVLLGAAMVGALAGNAVSLGLRGAAVSGRSALALFSPTALTALSGTHVGRVLTARLLLLLLAVPFLAYLLLVPRRAVHSHGWWLGSVGCAFAVLATHGMLSHAAQRGTLASAADAVHFGAMAVWLGGLVMLAVVLLPRRRARELSQILPRWSHLAFDSVLIAVVAGVGLLLLISPRWTAIPSSPYGRFLLVKLALVVALLATARRARDFVWDRLPPLAEAGDEDVVGARSTGTTLVGLDRVALQPLVTAVTAELCLAASILAATAALAGRSPPT